MNRLSNMHSWFNEKVYTFVKIIEISDFDRVTSESVNSLIL